MDLDAIYLVKNLGTYNFEDTVFLAADINAIVEKLMQPVVLKEVEKILFLAHLLKTTIDICRTIVRNYRPLEELLKVNWSSSRDDVKKLEFYETLAADDPVKVIAKRILLGTDGARCLGIMQEFYRMYYSKEDFKDLLANVRKSLPHTAMNNAFNSLKTRIHDAESDIGTKDVRGVENSITESKSTNLTDIVMLASMCTSSNFEKVMEDFREKLTNPNNGEMLNKQMVAVRSLFRSTKMMHGYQDALKVDKFYALNMTLLKSYHDMLLSKNICYDTNVVMLLYLLHSDGLHDSILRTEFLNESRIGSPDRLRILLLELQNFR